jgi:DNA mismatch repair protein MSH2
MDQSPNSPISPATASSHYEILGMIRRLNNEDLTIRTIRFFQKGTDTVDLFGDDAELVCDMIFKTESSLKQTCGEVAWLTLTTGQVAIALRELLLEGLYYIEVWGQELRGWKCHKKASPGNIEPLEEYLGNIGNAGSDELTSGDSNVIGAVWFKKFTEGSLGVSLVYADLQKFHIGYCEFSDNDMLMNLEVMIVQLGLKEIITPTITSEEYRKLDEISKTGGILITKIKNTEFDEQVASFDFPRLLKPSHALDASLLSEELLKCVSAIIAYLQLFRWESNLGNFDLIKYNSSLFMRIDESAIKSLLLLPSNEDRKKEKSYSLYGLLNHCKTFQGSRLLAQWIRAPLLDKGTIDQRLEIVESLIQNSQLRNTVRESQLRGMPDLARFIKKLIRDSANLQDLAVTFDAIGRCIQVADTLRSLPLELAQQLIVNPLDEICKSLLPFIKMIHSSLDFEAMARHEFLIKPTFDPSLKEIGDQQRDLFDAMEREAEKIAKKTGVEYGKKLKFEYSPTYGYHMRVPRGEVPSMNKVEHKIELAVLKSGLLFQTIEFKKLAEQYNDSTALFKSKQGIIVREMRKTSVSYISLFEQLNTIVAYIDVLMSFAQASAIAPKLWVKPKFDQERLILRASRHPLVESRQANQGDLFISNDVNLVKSYSSDESSSYFQILTGPNMGGKSTFMRQVGLIAIMAQIGCFVPCDEEGAILPIFDAVMVRVGAGDDLLKGVSTFLCEMLQMSAILKCATDRSLVLIDEMGRGTNHEEGSHIARHLIIHITKEIRCFGFFATHFHELEDIKIPGCLGNIMMNSECNFQVCPGFNSSSMGIELARKMGYPEEITCLAQLLYDLEDFSEERLNEVEEWMDRGMSHDQTPIFLNSYIPTRIKDKRSE